MARPRTRMTRPDRSPLRAFSMDANLTRRVSSIQLQNPAAWRGWLQQVTTSLDGAHESHVKAADILAAISA